MYSTSNTRTFSESKDIGVTWGWGGYLEHTKLYISSFPKCHNLHKFYMYLLYLLLNNSKS